MQNSYPLSEDVEPPSTDSHTSDSKGYQTSKSPFIHDFAHGRNSILKSHLLRKKHLKGNKSSSSFFAPFSPKKSESDGQLGDRLGSFDEDDERPPSASRSFNAKAIKPLRATERALTDRRMPGERNFAHSLGPVASHSGFRPVPIGSLAPPGIEPLAH